MACSAREPFRSIGRLHMVWGGGNGPVERKLEPGYPSAGYQARKLKSVAQNPSFGDSCLLPGPCRNHVFDSSRTGAHSCNTYPSCSHLYFCQTVTWETVSYGGSPGLSQLYWPWESEASLSLVYPVQRQYPGSDPGERIRLTRVWTGHGVSTNLTFQTPKVRAR
ncbi:phosphoribosyl transferase domain protein [Aspergillus luchuensis]|uniref:Phosphoribosyl transferase domain protein n=1 Tax=Aspergillus kawachii TaxID=1069201 RepID=A0A146FKS9_ASPKA|nr:phosphoribosyl transferase domain protein [Aspergillus luchuensis]